jgi:xanthine/uracil permease
MMRYYKLALVAVLTITMFACMVLSLAVSTAILVALPCGYIAYKIKTSVDREDAKNKRRLP